MKLPIRGMILAATILTVGCSNEHVALPVASIGAHNPLTLPGPAPLISKEKVVDVEWDDLVFDLKDRSKFDPAKLPQRIRDLDGKLIRVRGYILPAFDVTKRFALLAEIKTKSIPFTSGPFTLPLHHLMKVQMVDGKSTSFTLKPISVEGRFTIEEFQSDGKAICVFTLVADSVERVGVRSAYYSAMHNGC